MNDNFFKFNAFKPEVFNFKVAWLKDNLLEPMILCIKMSTFQLGMIFYPDILIIRILDISRQSEKLSGYPD